MAKSRGLGRGLDALFGEVSIDSSAPEKNSTPGEIKNDNEDAVKYIAINDIRPNSDQPRQYFDEDKIDELAESIKENGMIQPMILRKAERGYEIVAGERRWRAARRAGLSTVPCLVRELTDEQNIILALIENMQREDLNPIEEAEGLDKMMHVYGMTQEQVSKSVGKSRPYVANSVRLLKLSGKAKSYVSEGALSAGHARTLASVEDPEKQEELADKAVKNELSVRQLEELAKEIKKPRATARKKIKSSDVIQVEEDLKSILGTKVTLSGREKRGKIQIEYYSREELDRLIDLLKTLK